VDKISRVEKITDVDETLKMLRGVITNVQLQQFANPMDIPYFRSIFMRTTLPDEAVRRNKSGIVNLDNAEGLDTHWVAFVERKNRVVYFDSFSNFRPPKEFERYLAKYNQVQSYALSALQLKFCH